MKLGSLHISRFAARHRLAAVLLRATLLAAFAFTVLDVGSPPDSPTPWLLPVGVAALALHIATCIAAAGLCLVLPSDRWMALILLLPVPFLGWAIAGLYCWSARNWLEEELRIPVGRFGVSAAEVRRVLEGQRPCLQCGYDLTGNRSGRCPECGWVIPRGAG